MVETLKARIQRFKEELVAATDLVEFTSTWLFDPTPLVFQDRSGELSRWRHMLSRRLNVDPHCLMVIGSAAIGFSLNPDKNYSPFSTQSDVDCAVISNMHFEQAWHWLRMALNNDTQFKPMERNAIQDHKHRLVFYATIATDRILARLPFGGTWLSAVRDRTAKDPVGNREINLRLYRDLSALRAYQINGMRDLRESLLVT